MIQITTTSLPVGTISVSYNQTVATTGGVGTLAFTISTGTLPTGLSINATTGAITGTPSAAGSYNFTVRVEDDDTVDTQAFTVVVYDELEMSPDPISGDDSVYIEAGSQVQFSAAGGSGNYQWSVDGGNLINPVSGLLTAVNGGSYTVTVLDTESGQIDTTTIVITSQSQFCVEGAPITSAAQVQGDVCCEFNVECGDRLQLRVPSFNIVENGQRKAVVYTNVVQAVTGEAAALRSTSSDAGASGNSVSFARDAYFDIVTSFDMAQEDNGEFAVGWSSSDPDTSVNSIDTAVVWYTNGDDERAVEVRHAGTAETDSQFPIAQGDAVSYGVIDGHYKLLINNVEVFTSEVDVSSCGGAVLDVSIPDADKTIGGYVSNLTWSVVTTGSAPEVGSIDADGIYTSPTSPIAGIVKVRGSLNNANFFVNVRNIQPTPRFIKPNPFLAGRRAHVWVTDRKATDNDIIRIASDGSPDAIQNPGMIYLGVLEGSATFAEDNQTQDFTNDEGIYKTVVTEERATLTGTFLEVRDLDKLALMMKRATLYPKTKGVSELGVGGKTCGGCDLRVALIVEAGSCGGGWDVIYMPRAENVGNLSLEIGKKASGKYPLNFRILPDTARPAGKQLYSIYQIENCSDVGVGTDCE